MELPKDPAMLMSIVNMKFRDEGYTSLEELCEALDIDRDELTATLAKAGLEYNPSTNRIW